MSGKLLPILSDIIMKKDFGKEMYMVVHLNGLTLGDDLEGCLKICCSNKRALSKATGIRYFRLVYAFRKPKEGKQKSYLIENGMLILRSDVYYKGSQPGGFREKMIEIRNINH